MFKQEDHRNLTRDCCWKESIYENDTHFYTALPLNI